MKQKTPQNKKWARNNDIQKQETITLKTAEKRPSKGQEVNEKFLNMVTYRNIPL